MREFHLIKNSWITKFSGKNWTAGHLVIPGYLKTWPAVEQAIASKDKTLKFKNHIVVNTTIEALGNS